MTSKPVLVILTFFLAFTSAQSLEYLNKEGDIYFGNFNESANGAIFSKLESLLSNQTTETIEECWSLCVQNKECLSVNTIALDQSQHQCELLNWTGTGFENHLVPKVKSKFMQMKTVCSSNPCQNGGQCIAKDRGTNYTCTCANHTGRNCEINMCSPNPCQNGGQCTVKDGGTNYTCTCVGHTGRNCEINMCLPSPCRNGGQCNVKDDGADYSCTCIGHTGRNCEINMV
ncbi:Fat-like cadherin-related tumor suppressor-like [Exaiptasia diaphana]|nr:Fat-like cadherin-related tumor suppressor-like [Exaiptasia diaphana]